MTTYKVRDQFSELKEFTLSLSKKFDQAGLVIHNGRNVIKKIDLNEGVFVVKHFRGMYFFNRLAYSLFRESKAARSFAFAQILNERGIHTPTPVSYVDYYASGLLTKSYFVSVFWSYKTLAESLEHYSIHNPARRTMLLHDLAAFAFKLHSLGIYHLDFSLGNILVIESLRRHEFALVDLNRMKFGEVPYEKGLQNFVTLRFSKEDMNIVLREYARLSGQAAETSIEKFWKHHDRRWVLRKLRRKIRRYTISQFERILEHKPF